MAKKTPPFEEYPKWTNAKFWAFMRSGLRSKWSRWPPKWEVLQAASRPYKGPDKRKKKEYQCASCKDWFSQKDVSVDHIIPAGALSSWEDLADFCRRLFVGVQKLQVLCSTCHNKKSIQDRKSDATHSAQLDRNICRKP